MSIFDTVTNSVIEAYFGLAIPNTYGNNLGMILRNYEAKKEAKNAVNKALLEEVGYFEALGIIDLTSLSMKIRVKIYDAVATKYMEVIKAEQSRLGIDLNAFMMSGQTYNAILNALIPYQQEVRGSPLIAAFNIGTYSGFDAISYYIIESMWNTDVSAGNGLSFGTLLQEASLAKTFLLNVLSDYLSFTFGSIENFGEMADARTVARQFISMLNDYALMGEAYNFYRKFDVYKSRYGITTSLHTEINSTVENKIKETILGIQDQIDDAMTPAGPVGLIAVPVTHEVIEGPGFHAVKPTTPSTSGSSVVIGLPGGGGGVYTPADPGVPGGGGVPPPYPGGGYYPPVEEKKNVAMMASIGLGALAIILLIKR